MLRRLLLDDVDREGELAFHPHTRSPRKAHEHSHHALLAPEATREIPVLLLDMASAHGSLLMSARFFPDASTQPQEQRHKPETPRTEE